AQPADARGESPAAPGRGEPGTVEVAISGFAFAPGELTVSVGTTVVWTNRDTVPHTVTSVETPHALDSPVIESGVQYRYTFTTPGRYEYFCVLHPEMTGVVIVQ